MNTLDVSDDALSSNLATRDHFQKFFLSPIEQAQKKYSATTSMMDSETKQKSDTKIGSTKRQSRGMPSSSNEIADHITTDYAPGLFD